MRAGRGRGAARRVARRARTRASERARAGGEGRRGSDRTACGMMGTDGAVGAARLVEAGTMAGFDLRNPLNNNGVTAEVSALTRGPLLLRIGKTLAARGTCG